VRQLWPQILDAVKNRRRFTWILLSQNAQVVGFDGTTLQVGFSNAGARDSFVSGGSEEVLRQAVADALGGTQWRIEALVDPSGGGGQPGGGAVRAPAAPPAYAPPAPGPAYAPAAPQQQQQPPQDQQAAPPAPAPAQQAQQAPAARRPEPRQQAPAARPQAAPEPAPPPVDVEYDMPEDDDPDLDEAALSGHELIVRELGATVIEEIPHE
jgi:DNA polymerase-3 subunit gamma/tau